MLEGPTSVEIRPSPPCCSIWPFGGLRFTPAERRECLWYSPGTGKIAPPACVLDPPRLTHTRSGRPDREAPLAGRGFGLLVLGLGDDPLGYVRRHLVIVRKRQLKGSPPPRDRAQVGGVAEHFCLRDLGHHHGDAIAL